MVLPVFSKVCRSNTVVLYRTPTIVPIKNEGKQRLIIELLRLLYICFAKSLKAMDLALNLCSCTLSELNVLCKCIFGGARMIVSIQSGTLTAFI